MISLQEETSFPIKEGYTLMQQVGEELRIHGTRGPSDKKDCEVLILQEDFCIC